MARILIADDQTDVLAALRLLLKANRFDIETAASPAGVLEAIDSKEVDVVLMDLNYARDTTSGSEGLDLVTRIQGIDPTLRTQRDANPELVRTLAHQIGDHAVNAEARKQQGHRGKGTQQDH